MLRRVIEGLGMVVLVWALSHRIGAGPVIVTVLLATVAGLTLWRIRYVWHRYQIHLAMQARAERSGNTAVQNEMLALRGQQHARGAEMTFWTGFIMGGALAADAPNPAVAGEMGDMGIGGGAEGGMADMGGGIGGDM